MNYISYMQDPWGPIFFSIGATSNQKSKADIRREQAVQKAKQEYGIVTANDLQEQELQQNRELAKKSAQRINNYEQEKAATLTSNRPFFGNLNGIQEFAAYSAPGTSTLMFANDASREANLTWTALKNKQWIPALGHAIKVPANIVMGATSLIPFTGLLTKLGKQNTRLLNNLGKNYKRIRVGLELDKQILNSGNVNTIRDVKPIISSTPTPARTRSTSLVFLQKPNNLSTAEKLGIPASERVLYDPEIMQNAEIFAKKYGYPIPETVEEAKNMYKRHNTFFRGTNTDVFVSSNPDNYSYMADELIGKSREEVTKILASKGYPSASRAWNDPSSKGFSDWFVFATPDKNNALKYGGGDLQTVGIVRRPFSLRDPKKWHINADFRLEPDIIFNKTGQVAVGNTSPLYEVKINTKHLYSPGTLNQYPNTEGSLIGKYIDQNAGVNYFRGTRDYINVK